MSLCASIGPLYSARGRLLYTVGAVAIGYLLLRACASSRSRSLPSGLENEIYDRYVQCITPEDTAIWPGEPRQPECGSVDIRVFGEGRVPPEAQTSGITAALCYSVAYENPYWTTLGTTRHEVNWKSRTSLKVAVRQGTEWLIFPDEEIQDVARWDTYACPSP